MRDIRENVYPASAVGGDNLLEYPWNALNIEQH
jgi:hypothetical protein